MSTQISVKLKDLTCPNCAGKIEQKVQKLSIVEEASLNFSTGRLIAMIEEGKEQEVVEKIKKIVKDLEPSVQVISEFSQQEMEALLEGECNCANCSAHCHSHEEDNHMHEGHEHHHTHAHGADAHSHGHNHAHGHSHGEEDNKKAIIRIAVSAVLFVISLFFHNETLKFVGFIIAYFIVGYDVLLRALKNIFRGEVFDENFLMAIATVGAFCIREYPEGVLVMLLYQLGELFQDFAVRRSRKSISDLMDIRPDYANIEKDGATVKVSPEQVAIGDIIVVKTGEKVPLDGVVVDGFCAIDNSMLTGESVLQDVTVGSNVLSGCINTNGVIRLQVTKRFADSTVSKILDLVENAGDKKSNTEKFITKFSRVYTPVVVILALIVAVLPPLLLSQPFTPWIYKALTFLVMSCPCALVISIPLSFFAAIGAASRAGILVKGANCLEAISKADTIVFDKTGTLTKGVFALKKIKAVNCTEAELLEYAAHCEAYSSHPIAVAIRNAYAAQVDNQKVTSVQEIAGQGLKAVIGGETFYAGNELLMQQNQISYLAEQAITGTIVHVAKGNTYLGYIEISDMVKEDAKSAISGLKKNGVSNVVMLTGDNKKVADLVGKELGIDDIRSQLLPADKVEEVEKLLEKTDADHTLVFVGDGINDAPVIMRADVGIAMGALGSDAAIEAADIVIMTDELSKIPLALKIAKKTMRIAKQNIVFSLAVKFGILLLSLFSLAGMWAAVFADVGVMVLAVLNSVRLLRLKIYNK